MGYYTRFELEVRGGDRENDYEQEINEFADYGGLFEGEVKWYSCETDMREYSKNHPEVLFIISGEGEESRDIWEAYFRNGLMQMCKAIITYPEFNTNEMK